ncbi:2527_t:CDS:1, partial [Acaulospora colombiana]
DSSQNIVASSKFPLEQAREAGQPSLPPMPGVSWFALSPLERQILLLKLRGLWD